MKIYIQQLGTLTLIALLGFSAISGAQEDTWTGRADMPAPRSSLSNGAVNGKIYVIGGATNAPFKSLLTVEEYDPFRDTWRRRANMPNGTVLFIYQRGQWEDLCYWRICRTSRTYPFDC